MAENLDERVATCTEPGVSVLRGIEVNFEIPTYVTPALQGELHDIIAKIINHPYNQPKEGVHWLCYVGCKLILSDVDSAMDGRPPSTDPRKPADGEEPIGDKTIHCVGSAARGFANAKERDSYMIERLRGT